MGTPFNKKSEANHSGGVSLVPGNNDDDVFMDDKDGTPSSENFSAQPWVSSSSVSYPSVWLRLPNTSFGISLGLGGQSILWKSAQNAPLGSSIGASAIGAAFWYASALVACILLAAYVAKAIFHFPLIKDEFSDGARIHFFNMPHLILIILAISVPNNDVVNLTDYESEVGQRVVFVMGLVAQISWTQVVYDGWLFHKKNNISCARPQFLLSVVGWFFLAVLGAVTEIESAWGIALPTFCFGVGMNFYFMVVISVFNGLHAAPKARGNPALFLLIAPPSVAAVAWDMISNVPGEFASLSQMLLGWSLLITILLLKLGPSIMNRPPVLGTYWAYVFPMSALATACIRYSWAVETDATNFLAIITLGLAIFALFVVFCRMAYHMYEVARGKAIWGDPLLSPERLVSAKVINYTEFVFDKDTA